MIILFNNKFITKANAKISLFSEAVMYGYGVFETVRTHDKKIFKGKEHTNRLFQSAKLLKLKIKHKKPEILKMMEKVARKSPHKNQKIKVIAIEEGIYIISTKAPIYKKLKEKGVSCKTIVAHRELPKAKSLSYLSSYMSHKEATKSGYYEAILIDEKGEVYEGAYSNIFWFKGNTLCTRKEEVLEGIIRQTIINNSPFKIKFKNIKIKELLKKKEIFMTQSVSEILPITRIDKTKIGNGKVGEKTKEIIDIFKQVK